MIRTCAAWYGTHEFGVSQLALIYDEQSWLTLTSCVGCGPTVNDNPCLLRTTKEVVLGQPFRSRLPRATYATVDSLFGLTAQ